MNIEAAELMGKLHDKLKAIGYTGHSLELYLVRLLFCLFADDTSIFDKNIFHDYIEQRTAKDGYDLDMHLRTLFHILNQPKEVRLKNIDEQLSAFPYVNGKLFEEALPPASFDSAMRKALLDCCAVNWGKISPAIFGSLFQSVMDEKARRNLGAHYTSEKNILKVIKPLFLDELWKEFENARKPPAGDGGRKLKKLHDKISRLRFLDPACGCGNFLVIAYRELRLLELEIVKAQLKTQTVTSINDYFIVDVDLFYGIEYEEFPAQIAQVAMWLIDHQMNMQASEAFGEYYVRLPLRKSATIMHGNALRIDWQSLLVKETTTSIHAENANIILSEPEPVYGTVNVYTRTAQFVKAGDVNQVSDVSFDYILGNPPFVGKHLQNAEQKGDMDKIFAGVNGAGVLDYVTAWYIKAAKYMQHFSTTKAAFVSTNSISQGEQVGLLWNELFNKYKIKIHFAHRTFSWSNEAKGNATVHVVVIGFGSFDIPNKFIYEYENIKGVPHQTGAKNINPYLVEGKDACIMKRRKSIQVAPEISFGSMPNDGGGLLLSDEDKKEYLKIEPNGKKFIRPLLSAYEFINGEKRWCFWLVAASPSELKELPELRRHISITKKHRESSNREATKKLAAYPTLFGEIRQPDTNYILIPRHSSERRTYIPFGYFDKSFIVSDSCSLVANVTTYHFGILHSIMHMVWVNYTCGRLESRYRYSNELVYNNFPWPESPTEKQKAVVEKAAKQVLDARAKFPESNLADLYDPNTMPPLLVKAHQQLDKAVDLCYRSQPFANETKRIEFLFELYDKYTAGLFAQEKNKSIKKEPAKKE